MKQYRFISKKHDAEADAIVENCDGMLNISESSTTIRCESIEIVNGVSVFFLIKF